MEKKNRHTGRKIVLGVLTLAFVAALVAAPFVLEKRGQRGKSETTVVTGTAERGDISKTLSGTGTLTEEDCAEVTVPEGVEITEYLVKNGETVQAGQPVAVVDRTSVMRAVSSVNETLDELAAQINEAEGNLAEQYITAGSGGRVKAVYAEAGDGVRDTVLANGALAVISLDGKMAVDIEPAGLAAGQSVSVTLSGGETVAGTVLSLSDKTAEIAIDDMYGEPGEKVSVSGEDGILLGEGELRVHAPWNAIAYTGTVAGCYIRDNQKVWSGMNLFRLTGTEDTAEYELLTAKRRVYEDIAAELFLLYQDGTVKAPCEGRVSGVSDSLLKTLSANNGGYVLTLLAANTPNGADEAEYRNRVGVITGVAEDGTVTALLQLFDTQIDDYADLSGLNLDTGLMTFEATFAPGVIYRCSGTGEEGTATWEQSWEVTRGDIYVFAYDSDLAWMVYAGHADLPEEPEPPQEDDPGEGSEDAPGNDQGDIPAVPGGMGGGSGGFSGFGAGIITEEEEESLFSVAGRTILSVTPENTVTVTITVDELDILSVRKGQEVSVTIDALPGRSFEGEIVSIDTTAENSGGNTKYSVTVILDRTDKMLGGMNASAKITLLTRENVLTVPTAALCEDATETVVYTAYDSESGTFVNSVQVTTGLSDGMSTEILSGLNEGDTICYEYNDKLPDAGFPDNFPERP